MKKLLLPQGCYDTPAPYAGAQRRLLAQLLGELDRFGFEQVAPPLLEYTDTLLSGRGAALAPQTLRVMDPAANKVMGIRPDFTLQIARIAAARMEQAPLPLRLSYGGETVRLKPDHHDTARQRTQIGAEIIGTQADSAREILLLTVHLLQTIGVQEVTLDLQVPSLVPALVAEDVLTSEEAAALFAAVSRKDPRAIAQMKLRHAALLAELVGSFGIAATTLARLAAMPMPQVARDTVAQLETLVAQVTPQLAPAQTLTLDITESRHFDYHTDLSFSVFIPGSKIEIGRGGRYSVTGEDRTYPAIGVTMYPALIAPLLPHQEAEKARVLFDGDIFSAPAAALRAEGYTTLAYTAAPNAPAENLSKEAALRGCTHVYAQGKLQPL